MRRPDLIYFSKKRLHLIGQQAMEGPPDLCVEIISPSSVEKDTDLLFKRYAKAGIQEYWLIDALGASPQFTSDSHRADIVDRDRHAAPRRDHCAADFIYGMNAGISADEIGLPRPLDVIGAD